MVTFVENILIGVRQWITGLLDNLSYVVASHINRLYESKQDIIQDLNAIRSGASAGATALQPATNISGKHVYVDSLTPYLDGDGVPLSTYGLTSQDVQRYLEGMEIINITVCPLKILSDIFGFELSSVMDVLVQSVQFKTVAYFGYQIVNRKLSDIIGNVEFFAESSPYMLDRIDYMYKMSVCTGFENPKVLLSVFYYADFSMKILPLESDEDSTFCAQILVTDSLVMLCSVSAVDVYFPFPYIEIGIENKYGMQSFKFAKASEIIGYFQQNGTAEQLQAIADMAEENGYNSTADFIAALQTLETYIDSQPENEEQL